MKNRIINICLRAVLVVLFVSICSIAFADSYIPKEGEQFRFYPVAENSKITNKGFDCFYDPALAIKNGKLKIKTENRFKVDANGFTPFSEIEGHTFVIKETFKENADKKIDKQSFLCFLLREDGKEILLRIPYVAKNTDNVFTQQMVLDETTTKTDKWGKKTTNHSYLISLPAYQTSKFETIRNGFSGKYIVYHPFYFSDTPVKMEVVNMATTSLKTKTNYINDAYFLELNSTIYCKGISFMAFKGLAFTQPVAECIWNNNDIYFPVYNFKAAGDYSSGLDFSMPLFFVDKETFISEELRKRINSINKNDYINYDFRFQKSEIKNYSPYQNDRLSAAMVESSSNYTLIDNEVYHCYGVDLCTYKDGYSSTISFLFQDKNGRKFQVGLFTITANNSKRYKPIFIREDKYQAEIQRQKEEDESRRREIEYRKAERLRRLTQLYGASNAKIIVEGKVRIGFTKSMCREAWGNPDDINRTTTSWGTHEQWVYGHESYLYFDGDKLTTIQN